MHFAPARRQRHHAHRIQTVVDQVVVIERFIGLVQQRQDHLTQRRFAGGDRCWQQFFGHHHPARTSGHIFQRHQMLVTAEIGQRICHHKRFNIAHKCVRCGGHTANVGIYPGNNQLVTSTLFQHLLQRGTMKRAVAPLHQHRVVGIWRQAIHHLLLFRRTGQAWPPHIIQQRPIFIALLFRLGGVINRDIVLFAVVA